MVLKWAELSNHIAKEIARGKLRLLAHNPAG